MSKWDDESPLGEQVGEMSMDQLEATRQQLSDVEVSIRKDIAELEQVRDEHMFQMENYNQRIRDERAKDRAVRDDLIVVLEEKIRRNEAVRQEQI